jgi:hypothetical protein
MAIGTTKYIRKNNPESGRLLFGSSLPEEADWLLIGRFMCDRALVRDAFAFELFRQMGNPSVRTRFVDVFLNFDGDELETEDYYGLYLFTEKIERGRDPFACTTPMGKAMTPAVTC